MRTAEQILDNWLPKNMDVRDCVLAAINDARKEAIEECAKQATIKETGKEFKDVPTGSNFETANVLIASYSVDKQSILNLINELK